MPSYLSEFDNATKRKSMRMLKMDWGLSSGDGTGTSINDMRVRNENGICGIQGCGNSLGEDSGFWMFGKICQECDNKFKKFIDTEILGDFN